MTKLSLIAAVAENGVIGKDNAIPWRISADMKYFKKATVGKPIIMGRKTWQSLGKPLPGRRNIVISRTLFIPFDEVDVVPDFSTAFILAQKGGAEEVMVIGGAAVYAEALPDAERLYLTEVHGEVEGDTFFPSFDRSDWVEVSRDFLPKDDKSSHDCSFVVFERRSP